MEKPTERAPAADLPTPRPLLVSACLLGLLTRYDGATKSSAASLEYLRRENFIPIPVCPEQLAGLPTPRPATWFAEGDGEAVLDGAGKVVRADGTDMNRPFSKGAFETLMIARLAGCRDALLKERSPSCGVHQIYRGTEIVPGRGITAALLARNGIRIFSEEDL
jgi:uncharacterized protein YbbK (DUF523 family)